MQIRKKTGEYLRFVILEKINQYYNPEGDFLVTVDSELVKKLLTNFIDRQRDKKSSKTRKLLECNTKQSALKLPVLTTP